MEKKPIPLLGIPILNRGDLLERLICSIDYPVQKLFIVNNGNDIGVLQVIHKIVNGLNENIKEVVVYTPEKNLGVAGSWNTIINENMDCPYWVISANDMMFSESGSVEKMAFYAEQNHLTNAMMYVDGYSCFCMTQLGLKEVGTFDENIFPAYLEDSDHFYRLRLSGAIATGFPDVKFIHGEPPNYGSSTINTNDKYQKANGITHGRNFEYYFKKWGGRGGEEIFKNPFNDSSKSIKFWELDVERRKIQEETWK